MTVLLDERFQRTALDARLQWLNPPPVWCVDTAASVLVVCPAAQTDFWQETHYGFRADSGHFLHAEVGGDFTMTTRVRSFPAHQYDQAGLMVRAGPTCWLKTSVEFEPEGPARLGAVVTNRGFSDWSIEEFPRDEMEVWLRVRKESLDFMVEWKRQEHGEWNLMRVAHLDLDATRPLECGLYAASPKGGGFRAEFQFLTIVRLSECLSS